MHRVSGENESRGEFGWEQLANQLGMNLKGFDYPKDPKEIPDFYYEEWKGAADFLGFTSFLERTPEECVSMAEVVAKENGGVLPLPARLWETSPEIAHAMRRDRKMFAHIPQEKSPMREMLEEWVWYAEDLAATLGGKLPADEELARDYPELLQAMGRNRRVFSQLRKTNSKKHCVGLVNRDLVEHKQGWESLWDREPEVWERGDPNWMKKCDDYDGYGPMMLHFMGAPKLLGLIWVAKRSYRKLEKFVIEKHSEDIKRLAAEDFDFLLGLVSKPGKNQLLKIRPLV